MEHQNSDSISQASDRIDILRERRAVVLSEITQLDPDPSVGVSDERHQLQQEYNALVDEEVNLTKKPLRDPFQALPPELWGDFVLGTVDEILTLTLVSQTWHRILISLPRVWTDINIDLSEGDSLAKAMVCLHLSRPLRISLRIKMSSDLWKEVGSPFIAEGSRIRSLKLLLSEGSSTFEAFWILKLFKQLPVLSHLGLLSDKKHGSPYLSFISDSLIFGHFPSLTEITHVVLSTESLKMTSFANLVSVCTYGLDHETIDALTGLHELRALTILDQPSRTEPDLLRVKQSDCCLLKVKILRCMCIHSNGREVNMLPALSRAVQCTGQSLTTIVARAVNICAVPSVLASFGRFQRLRNINLEIVQEFSESNMIEMKAHAPLKAVKVFSLTFWGPSHSFDLSDGREQTIRIAAKECFSRLFESLALLVPHVEDLNLGGWAMAAMAVKYIKHLHHLRTLSVTPTAALQQALASELDGGDEERAFDYLLTTNFLDHVQSQFLHSLQLNNALPLSQTPSVGQTPEDIKILIPRYALSSTPMHSVTTLTLVTNFPFLGDLLAFPALKVIAFDGNTVTWASDFFEELLIQPNNWPALERIRILGEYLEWDILLLMLERRNFVANTNVKHIKSIEFLCGLPYKLLYPISRLLQGKFVDRSPLSEFSSVEIGNRMWDPLITGCRRCLSVFRSCELPLSLPEAQLHEVHYLVAESINIATSSARLSWDYQLPLERLPPSPALPPNVHQWLAGKRERRRKFNANYEKVDQKGVRSATCPTQIQNERPQWVTGDSLDGAKFEY